MTVQAPDSAMTHWVFGYGSLIWNPGFAFIRRQRALLMGAHRSLSVLSHHYRGTVEQPGLVFGLARGGSCHGMAFEVADADWIGVHDYLRQREQVTMVYKEAFRPVRLAEGGSAVALTYLVDERHEQYAGELSLEQQAEMVRAGVGIAGPNIDYVVNTAQHLAQLGIRDRALSALASRLLA
ncbi:gamma-glutamylcyclotransferase [Devosia sp.]|uniref:gamma-glutamylcyclotransferase n=1 Tax=Devosia sp. TaxID=1871048 RepID=UPI003264B246